MNITTIVENQSGWFTSWYVFQQPLAVLIFFIAATAEANRTPFDLTEADSEIVAGLRPSTRACASGSSSSPST